MDRLSPPVCEFALDEEANVVRFKGGFTVEGSGYALIAQLLPSHRYARAKREDVPYLPPHELADLLKVEEQTIRQRISRINGDAAAQLAITHGIVLPGGLIENKRSEGYRLSPEARQVELADLGPSGIALSQGRAAHVTKPRPAA